MNSESNGKFKVVEFVLGEQVFAFNLLDVREIVECPTITQIPNADASILGIIDLRGNVTTIIDLKTKLNMEQGGENTNSYVIVLDEEDAKTGINVDEVLTVSEYDDDQIDRYVLGKDGAGKNIIGVIMKEKERDGVNELILLLDIRKILEEE
jgi:purine-binding chemotaxis protein CheW